MIVGGMHSSLDELPTTMFARKGKGGTSTRKKVSSSVNMAETLIDTSSSCYNIVCTFTISIKQSSKPDYNQNEPCKTNRIMFQQLHDLSNFKASGVVRSQINL